ncbi:DUF6807 family protein [Crateriforma spongiae]|uniref:DUF6807 family protein n=1 Tax=Crateriforma spongiae TaxID=2724528 RepID=UPI00144758BD|nr:DUF6807 family protein [Crateriforma spongiae]
MRRSGLRLITALAVCVAGLTQLAIRMDAATPPDIASIRQAIEDCGGHLELDDQGRPIKVDLAADRGSADQAGFDAAIQCKTLTSLRLRAPGLSEADLAKIRSLSSLQELSLQDVRIDDDFVADVIAKLADLRRLTLRNTPGVSKLQAIASLPNLTHLSLIDLPIDGPSLDALATAAKLAALDLRLCSRLSGRDFDALHDVANLKDLKLGGYGIDNESMRSIASIDKLSNLTIEDASIDAVGIQALAPIAGQLQALSFARCAALDDTALQFVSRLPSLRSLMLRDMPVTGTFLKSLAAPANLETLGLRQTFLIDETFDAIAQCGELKRLDLPENFLPPGAIAKIATLSKLQILNLSSCSLDNASLEPLKQLQNLQTLHLDGNPNLSRDAAARILDQSSSTTPSASCRIVSTQTSTECQFDGKTLWRYHHNPAEGKPYFHPLAAIGRDPFTDLRPEDHPWHRGLWFSWKFIDGVNYWEENRETGQSDGQTRLLSTRQSTAPSGGLLIEQTLAYAPYSEASPVMTESRTLAISAPEKSPEYHIDWTSQFSASETALTLDRTPIAGQPRGKTYGGYAGLSIRMNAKMQSGSFFNADGQSGLHCHGKASPWMIFQHDSAGSLLFMDHPNNFSSPTKWYVTPSMPYFSPAVLFDAGETIAAEETRTLRYRIVVSSQTFSAKDVQSRWANWIAQN